MKINIATGKSRLDKKWQNKQVTWETFIAKIKDTHRTAELLAEYVTFKKERQDEIKDIGGFVGGHLAGGRRLASAVTTRQLLTLDADSAEKDFWERFCLQYDCAAAIYSTHKHTPENPRYRLVIPLSREVFCDEYTAICRRIAGDTGIDQYDPTGYQPHRLMYWPSTPKDGEYVFQEQQGQWLDPDAVLGTYVDWKDVSEWPTALKENKALKQDAKRQGEPWEKPGLIGAFNCAYSISSCIETFLSDVYETCNIEGRYTYKEGSTAAGVIVYDDKFLYSHHSTDPASNILCNSFDLLRIHKYALLDSDDPEIPVNKKPSYLAMCDFAAKDTLIKQQLGEAKIMSAQEAFAEVDVDLSANESMEERGTEWLKKMDVDRKGNYLSTINNIAIILEHDPVYYQNIAFDDFEQQAIFKRNLPWRKVTTGSRIINDNDLANIENYIEKVYKLSPGNGKLQKGLLVVLEKFRFHPVVDYLNQLKWDGVQRVDQLMVKYLGTRDDLYTRTVTRKSLVACVARVMVPGIKFDNILTLVGEEGQGKSALFDKLGGKWFTDSFNMHMLQSKEAYEQIQGVWIIEIGELAGMAKAEVERVKSFISARQDRYRSPYARTTEHRLRQCIFFASTNTFDFLKSQTGNRRFWPVATFENEPEGVVFDIEQDEIDQIWAEAVVMFRNKEPLYLPKALNAEAVMIQEDYTEEDPMTEQIRNYLDMKVPKNWYELTRWDKIDFVNNYESHLKEDSDLVQRSKVCKYELWEIALERKEPLEIAGLKRIKQVMHKVKNWVKESEYVRFGNYYPRHKGSYKRVYSLEELVA